MLSLIRTASCTHTPPFINIIGKFFLSRCLSCQTTARKTQHTKSNMLQPCLPQFCVIFLYSLCYWTIMRMYSKLLYSEDTLLPANQDEQCKTITIILCVSSFLLVTSRVPVLDRNIILLFIQILYLESLLPLQLLVNQMVPLSALRSAFISLSIIPW